MAKNRLSGNDIAEAINSENFGNESDVDGLSDDENEIELIEVGPDDEMEIEITNAECAGNDDGEILSTKEPRMPTKQNFSWVRKDFIPSASMEVAHDYEYTEPMLPYQYFTKFMHNKLIEDVCEKTNMYYLQNTGKNLNTKPEEIKILFGIHIEMGSLGFPNRRVYWSKARRHEIIADAMTFNRFSTLRNNLHCVDNLQNNQRDTDKFWKVRPIMDDYLKELSKEIPEKRVCVDEQLIPFKGKLQVKQYMKGKPNPWGIKLFFLCGESGMPYNFIDYQGKSTNLPEEYNHLGISGSVVVALVENRLEPLADYRLFFDNFFTSPRLVAHLSAFGIYCTGTVRSNRVGGNLPIKSNKDLVKEGRGSMDGCTSSDGEMCLLKWNDNSIVTVLSSAYAWNKETGHVCRWDKTAKAKVEIPCPSAVLQYNRSMGGVDKLDFLMSLYRIHIKSKKWPLRVIFHFVDLAVVTSWLQYRRDCESVGMALPEQMTLLKFRFSIAECMIKCGSNPLANVTPGRPTKRVPQRQAENAVKYDGIGHFPEWKKERKRCKKEGCNGPYTYAFCIKCKISLCFNKDRNCFLDFHTPR